MKFTEIDWAEIWRETLANASWHKHRHESDLITFWNDRAKKFNDDTHRERVEDLEEIIAIAQITSETSVLDIGAGTGRFAIPLAQKAQVVTVVEPSPGMLQYLANNAQNAGVSQKIRTVNHKWEDLVVGKTIEPHDVVIAPYVFGNLDASRALPSLVSATKRFAFIFTWVTRFSPAYHRLWADIHGEPYTMSPEHLLLLNLLYCAGVHANLKLSFRNWWEHYPSLEAAFEDYKKRVNPAQDVASAEKRISAYVTREGVPTDQGVKFPDGGISAMVWWEVAK